MNLRQLLFALCLAVVIPLPAGAVTCHCFRDRDFNPAQPAKADDFLLTSARIALLAGAFGIERGDVVKARMAGTSEESLWIAHTAAARTGTEPSRFLDAREKTASWSAALRSLGASTEVLGPGFSAALKTGRTEEEAASALADPFLAKLAPTGETTVRDLREAGADNAQAAAALLLQSLTNRPGTEALRAVRAGAATWGGLFHDIGITPGEVGGLVTGRLRK